VEPLRLLLQVVEEVEEAVLPAHRCTLTEPGRGVNLAVGTPCVPRLPWLIIVKQRQTTTYEGKKRGRSGAGRPGSRRARRVLRLSRRDTVPGPPARHVLVDRAVAGAGKASRPTAGGAPGPRLLTGRRLRGVLARRVRGCVPEGAAPAAVRAR